MRGGRLWGKINVKENSCVFFLISVVVVIGNLFTTL